MEPDMFLHAWHFLHGHPMFKSPKESRFSNGNFQQCLDIMVTQVNPANDTIEDDKTLNTKTVVWLECGPYEEGHLVHDLDLDCGADTFEEAIIELADLVYDHYGPYKKPELTEEERQDMDAFFKEISDRSAHAYGTLEEETD